MRFEFFIRLLRELCRLWRKLIQLILRLRFGKFSQYIMSSCCFVISCCVLHFLRSKEKLWIVTLSSLWMGHTKYFSLGNSNSLASVDISAGYAGLCRFRTLYHGPSHICSHLLRSMFMADGWNLVCYTKRQGWSKVCKVTYTPVHLTGDQGLFLFSDTTIKDQGNNNSSFGTFFADVLSHWLKALSC